MSLLEDELNPAADERYLGALLLSVATTSLRDEALRLVDPDDFHHPGVALLWAGARTLAERGFQINRRRLLAAALAGEDQPIVGRDGRGGTEQQLAALVATLAADVPVPARFPVAVEAVSRAGKLRRLIETCQRITQRAMSAEDISTAYEAAHDEFARLDARMQADTADARSLAELLPEFERQQVNRDMERRIPTPWPKLDDVLDGGLWASRLYVIGGRPGGGKSLAGGNLAAYAAAGGHPSLIFTAEMPDLEFVGRLVADGANITLSEINRRDLGSVSWQRYHEYATRARSWPLWIVDRPDLTVDRIRAIARQHKRRHGLDVVAIDYLQLLKPTSRVPRQEQVAEISRGCKLLSRELDVAVLLLAQLNRDAGRGAEPQMEDLRESGAIEQDADVIILLDRKKETQGEEAGQYTGEVVLIIPKHRQGRTDRISMTFKGQYARLEAR